MIKYADRFCCRATIIHNMFSKQTTLMNRNQTKPHYLYTIYTLFIHYLHTIYTLFIHFLYTIYTLFIHFLYTIYTLFIHYLYNIYTHFIHYLYISVTIFTIIFTVCFTTILISACIEKNVVSELLCFTMQPHEPPACIYKYFSMQSFPCGSMSRIYICKYMYTHIDLDSYMYIYIYYGCICLFIYMYTISLVHTMGSGSLMFFLCVL